MLGYLKSWHPVDQLSLKQLIIKTLALIVITTSDRSQTLHLMNIKKMHISDTSIPFTVTNKLKNINRVIKPKNQNKGKMCQFLRPSLGCLCLCLKLYT